MQYYLGLDLGQANDNTALTILEAERMDTGEDYPPWEYRCRHAERLELGTSYPDVVRHVETLMQRAPLKGNCRLVVDATGVGRPVVDMFKEAGLSPKPIWITGGDQVTTDGIERRVPKRELVSTLQALLQSGRLTFADGLKWKEAIKEEMRLFRAKINVSTGHDSFEAWRERDKDDLVLALAMAAWYAENGTTEPVIWV
jgi:hypothetical protein